MDSDQEVVREPFEGEEFLQSVDQSSECNGDTSNLAGLNQISLYDGSIQGGETVEDIESKRYNQVDHDTSSEDNSSSFAEDSKFAKTFDIQLKDKCKKRQSAYNKLLELEKEESSAKQKPTIKTSVTSDCIYHKGTFYQKGDIVALCDQDDGQLYFAQLTGFLQDQYCEKSASINWLVPIRPTSRDFFDPSAYQIGLEDVQLRKLECMTFVRHCPHDYYLRKLYQSECSSSTTQADQTSVSSNPKKNQAYIWTTMKPCPVPTFGT